MKLVEYDKKKLGDTGRMFKRSKHQIILEEFIDSGMDCAKIEGWEHKTAKSLQNSLSAAIKRYKLNTVRAIIRNDEVFLVRKDLEE